MPYKSTRLIADIKLILTITLAWMVLGVFFTLFDYVTTNDNFFYCRTEHYNFIAHLSANLGGSFLGGILGGSFIVFYSNRKLRNRSFLSYILLNSFAVITIIFLINLLITQSVMLVYFDSAVFDVAVLEYMKSAWRSLQMLRGMVTWFIISLFTTFLIRVSEKYGPGVLGDIIMGKYHKPKEEERIFMFLDIKSSTTLAETLGHKEYFKLLKDFYADITDAITYNQGSIYQYVGDEVVVSWKIRKGIIENRCLKCFFEAKEAIKGKESRYIKKYSIVPVFKAGMHIGKATVGEIGVMKKEIAFSGDVLNTTARIQNECNKYGAELLISQDLLDILHDDNSFSFKNIGGIDLRGKKEKTILYSVQKNKKEQHD